jgi:ribosomal protein S18 acetylase RimI-like enzyme
LITTRIATLADLDAVAPLFDAYRQFYERAPDPALARQFIQERMRNNQSAILLALDAGRAIGFCQLYPMFCSVEAKPIYVLYDLFVGADARRAGAAKALLLAAEELAARNGKVRMDLSTARTNRAAQCVYESLGWSRDELFLTYNKRVDASG